MAYEVARVHGLIRSKLQELEAKRGTKVALVDSEVCSVPQIKHQSSGLSQDSHFPPNSQRSEMSLASPLGYWNERRTQGDEEDHIMADLLDQMTHSIIDDIDASEEQFPTLEAVESSTGETPNSYTTRTPHHSLQVDMPVASSRIAAAAAASPSAEATGSFSSKTYAESVTASKSCSLTDSSIQQFEASSTRSNSTRSTSYSPRSREESQHGRSPRTEGFEWKQRQAWFGQGQHFYKGGGLKKAGRCQSLPRTGAMPGAVEWNGGPGMQAVFLRSESSKRESGGTGVFIPTSMNGGSSDQRQKPACSIVLLPLRIIQVLNLNVENMRCHPGSLSRSKSARVQPSPMYVMELSPTRSKPQAAATCFRTSHQTFQPQPLELGLPTEWTY